MDERQQIKDRISIVDLVAESIPLKKAGRNFKGVCPFHNERTPSFVVSPERQIWHCFGCGKGGDIFTFMMELDHLDFPEALQLLAQRAGVTLSNQPFTSHQQERKQRLLAIHQLASEFYHFLLTKHQIGERARLYIKNRGISAELITTFTLGFAPNAWDNVTKFLIKKGFTQEELEQSGLSLPGKRGLYDRFRGRIMFPLKNYRGETIAFAGRLLDKDAKDAKYINSPETPLYIKGDTLYGLDVTKDAIRKKGAAVVVEGEFDCISSFAAGVSNVVAIKGSALTQAQIALLKRFTERLVLALDQDTAGDAASRRGIELAERAGLDIRVVTIPTGKDPDEAARQEPHAWKEAVEKAVPYYDFLIASATRRYDTKDPYGKKKISDELLPMLAKISNPIIQAHYIKQIGRTLEVGEERIMAAMRRVPNSHAPAPQSEPAPKALVHEDLLEEHLLALTLQSPTLKQSLDLVCNRLDPSDLMQPAVRQLFIALLDFASDKDVIDPTAFAASLPQELVTTFDRAFLTDLTEFAAPEVYAKEVEKTLLLTVRSLLKRRIKTYSVEIARAQASGDAGAMSHLTGELSDVTRQLKQLSES
jgi:DNA primase